MSLGFGELFSSIADGFSDFGSSISNLFGGNSLPSADIVKDLGIAGAGSMYQNMGDSGGGLGGALGGLLGGLGSAIGGIGSGITGLVGGLTQGQGGGLLGLGLTGLKAYDDYTRNKLLKDLYKTNMRIGQEKWDMAKEEIAKQREIDDNINNAIRDTF
jgi:hypothetical protein